MRTFCLMTSAANLTSFKQLIKASLIIQVSLLFLWGCGSSKDYVTMQGATMGTTYHVTTQLADKVSASQIQQEIDDRLKVINQSMSTYIPDSEISRFNELPLNQPMDMSDDFMAVFLLSKKIYKLTDGAFDPSVAALVDLWGFGPQFRMQDTAQLPTEEKLNKARAEMGFADIQAADNTLTKTKPVRLDFSAIAKGYAVDQIAEVIAQYGIDNYMVEIGGEVRTEGQSPRKDDWRIAIEAPEEIREDYPTTLYMQDASTATSGDYRNFYEFEGKRYSHVINPKTGKPVKHQLTSVTVMDASVAEADAWATALLVMGEKDGFELARQKGLAIFMVFRTDKGFDAAYTDPMKDYLNINQ